METKNLIREIEIPVYWNIADNGKITIDEDSIREEFETRLREIQENIEEYNKGIKLLKN